MLHYAIVFFLLALLAALFGFSSVAVGAASLAKLLFAVFLIAAAVTVLAGELGKQ